MSGNRAGRVDLPIDKVTGPIFGKGLLETFKLEVAKEAVFQAMFGPLGERVFVAEMPNVNETILPAIELAWKRETFKSVNTYLDGQVVGRIYLPTQLKGDYNSMRRVASIFQRWLSTRFKPFTYPENKGLTMFGFGTEFDYTGLATFNGLSCPVIQMTLPFRYDLALLRGDYDPNLPLDNSDLGFIKEVLFNIFNEENKQALTSQRATIDNS